MTRFAIVHPSDVLGQELKELLEERHPDAGLAVLTRDETEVGTLTEVMGAAAMVQRLGEGDLESVEVAFFCGAAALNRPLLADLPAGTTGILLSPDAGSGDGRPVVAGVNDGDAEPGTVLLSPHPGAVLLTHLLAPLAALAPERAAATLLHPASLHGQEGLDELFEQTRSILAFRPERPQAIFGRQLAFSHFPLCPARSDLGELVRQSLGRKLPVTARLLQGGVFHGLSASLFVRFADDPGTAALREALSRRPPLELLAVDAEQPAPIDVAARREILVGAVEPDPHDPGSYWLWAVMDNLTVGGALNALGIAESVLAQAHPVS